MLKTPNQILYIPFDGDTNDYSGNLNNGVPNRLTYENGLSGKRAIFNTSYVTLSSSFIFYKNTSICCWIDFTNTNITQYLFSPISTNIGIRYNGIDFLVFAGGTGWSALNWTKVNEPVFLTIIRTGNMIYDFYINGEYIGFTNSKTTVTLSLNRIGRRNDGYYFDGTIEDLSFYNTKLSQSDIKRIMLGMHPLNG